jgi:hypothetical protein
VNKKNGIRQVVVLDESNENEIIVEAGLKEGDKVLLSVPEESEKYKFEGLELVELIRQKEEEKRRLEEEQQTLYEEQFNPDRPMMDMPHGGMRDTSHFRTRPKNMQPGERKDTSRS